jgi:hypothetical protein
MRAARPGRGKCLCNRTESLQRRRLRPCANNGCARVQRGGFTEAAYSITWSEAKLDTTARYTHVATDVCRPATTFTIGEHSDALSSGIHLHCSMDCASGRQANLSRKGATHPIAPASEVLHDHTPDGRAPDNRVANVTSKPERGNSRAYILERLLRERPGLHAAVAAGDLSANAAAIEAGFRKKPTPFEQIVKLLPRLSSEQKRKLMELLA